MSRRHTPPGRALLLLTRGGDHRGARRTLLLHGFARHLRLGGGSVRFLGAGSASLCTGTGRALGTLSRFHNLEVFKGSSPPVQIPGRKRPSRKNFRYPPPTPAVCRRRHDRSDGAPARCVRSRTPNGRQPSATQGTKRTTIRPAHHAKQATRPRGLPAKKRGGQLFQVVRRGSGRRI